MQLNISEVAKNGWNKVLVDGIWKDDARRVYTGSQNKGSERHIKQLTQKIGDIKTDVCIASQLQIRVIHIFLN